MDGTHRLLIHGRVNPNQAGDVEAMDELKQRWNVSAWKTYTQWGRTARASSCRTMQVSVSSSAHARWA